MDLLNKKLFVFDFDGTLIDSNKIKKEAYFQVLEYNQNYINYLELIMNKKQDLDRFKIFQILSEEFVNLKPDYLTMKYTNICLKRILKANEIQGAYKFLKFLNKNKKIIIINSATPKKPLEDIVKHLKFKKYIYEIYGRPSSKEDNFKDALKKFNISIKDSIIFGDTENDRKCAEYFDCDFIGIKNELSNFKSIPKYNFSNYNEILNSMMLSNYE